MKPRHQSRMLAVQFLFQRDFNQNDFEDALRLFWLRNKTSEKVKSFADTLIRGVSAHREGLDERIQEYAKNWDVKRMGALDRNVLRMALYEMLYCLEIPPVVSINEAVDIAKEFSSIQSGHFVNGILDRAKQDLKRPLRTVKPVNLNSGWSGEKDQDQTDQPNQTNQGEKGGQ